MSLSSGATKTVLELDLMSYSDIARVLEENLDVYAVKAFQDQIQSFVDNGLRLLGLHRNDVVFGTAGDNALLFFDDAVTAHRFSEGVQKASAEYNRQKEVESAKRWFRIGAATGPVLVLESERQIVGTTVARAVRLEAAASKGELVVDARTFDALTAEIKACYGPEELVCGKRNERFSARRCSFLGGMDGPTPVADRADGVEPQELTREEASRRESARGLLREFLRPIHARLQRDNIIWRRILDLAAPEGSVRRRIAERIERDYILPNHDEVVGIMERWRYLVASDSELSQAVDVYVRHVIVYKALRSTGDTTTFPLSVGARWPDELFPLIEQRIESLEREFPDLAHHERH